jgi:hypothetical protein
MIKADVAELVDARDLKCLATPERSHFFGKRDLTFGINLLQRSEIWKTFWGPLVARLRLQSAWIRYGSCREAQREHATSVLSSKAEIDPPACDVRSCQQATFPELRRKPTCRLFVERELRQITPAPPPLNAKTQRSLRPPLAPTTNVLELAEQSVFFFDFCSSGSPGGWSHRRRTPVTRRHCL